LPGRGEVEQQNVQDRLPQPTSVQVEDKDAIPTTPCALEGSDVHFDMTGLSLTTPKGEPLDPKLQSLLAGVDDGMRGDQPISVVCNVRDAINQRLSDAGYVALAQIPAQQIKDGTLHIEVVTARITEVRIVGDVGPFRDTLEKRIALIRALDPLNRHDAERILLEMGDIPGLDVRLSLSSANGAPGDVVGTMTVVSKRFSLLANVQNFGSRQLGRWIGSVRAEAYGLTGMADRTFLSYSNSTDFKEVRVLQAGHDFALNNSGLRFGVRGSLAWSRPDLPSLDLRSQSVIVGAELSNPIVRSVNRTIGAAIGFEMLNQKSDVHASGAVLPLTKDHIRVAYARLDGQFHFVNGMREIARLDGRLELRKGLDVFGATKKGQFSGTAAPSRFDGDPTATVIRGEASADILPGNTFEFDLAAYGQWSNHPVLNLEEYSVGNFTHGRGYDPGSVSGDRAYGFTVEPRVNLPVTLGPVQVQASAFYDWIHIENLDAGTINPKQTLRSVGGGLRLVLPQRMVLDVTYAHPLDKIFSTDKKKPSDRVLVSLTAKLF